MSKITTKFIKDNVLPSGNWKRTTKRKFQYNNDVCIDEYQSKTFVLDGKLNWRRYDTNTRDTFYVIDDGTDILYSGDCPWLPMSCFVFGWDIYELDYISIYAGYKEEFDDLGDYSDNLRCESIAGFIDAFKSKGILISNSMECCWEVYVKEDEHFDVAEGAQAFDDFFGPIIKSKGGEWDGQYDECGCPTDEELDQEMFDDLKAGLSTFWDEWR